MKWFRMHTIYTNLIQSCNSIANTCSSAEVHAEFNGVCIYNHCNYTAFNYSHNSFVYVCSYHYFGVGSCPKSVSFHYGSTPNCGIQEKTENIVSDLEHIRTVVHSTALITIWDIPVTVSLGNNDNNTIILSTKPTYVHNWQCIF